MGRLSDLLSRADLSDEDREILRAEEARIARLEEQETERQKNAQLSEVVAYCGSPDGSVKGKLDELSSAIPASRSTSATS
jgi:predicted PP-loop superfamily ATPase